MRDLGKPETVDADTLFMIASNTKAMTTLLLAGLVDEGKLGWDTPVTSLLPSFKLGDADTTRQVLVRHLICACTGLPRQDFEWLLEFKNAMPESALAVLGTIQPTSKFGEMFQYSNGLAAAAGYVAGHVAFPELELGAAYDRAMMGRVFGPLGMSATTFDFTRALQSDHASPHALDIDDKPAAAVMDVNYAIVPVRPAGGAWSNVRDVLRYVTMELARGALPDGTRYIHEAPLLVRREPQVPIGRDEAYGMGLMIDSTWGIPVVHHGGSLIGYKTDMMFLPDHNVGAVILTNSDAGQLMLGPFQRKLLEVLFDGEPLADARLSAAAKSLHAQIAAERPKLTVPPAADAARALAAHYHNEALGDIDVSVDAKPAATSAAGMWFDFGEWKSRVASRKNEDGTSLVRHHHAGHGRHGIRRPRERQHAHARVPRRATRVRLHGQVARSFRACATRACRWRPRPSSRSAPPTDRRGRGTRPPAAASAPILVDGLDRPMIDERLVEGVQPQREHRFVVGLERHELVDRLQAVRIPARHQ